jgi:hypothetical protein
LPLRIYKKDREGMKYLTEGRDAFFVFIYNGDNAIISDGNVGDGETISLSSVDYGEYPIEKLEKLMKEVISVLGNKLELKFAIAVGAAVIECANTANGP